MDHPMLAEMDQFKPILDAMTAGFGLMINMVNNGLMPAESILQQLESSPKPGGG
jgi:hypothetical protein